jgi:putative transposase
MRYRFISERQDYPAAKWASFLNVSRSGYYSWLKGSFIREGKRHAYFEEIKRIFNESGGTYGPDRIVGVMRKSGHRASFGRVKSYMESAGMRSIHRNRKARSLTDSRKSRGSGYANLAKGLEITSPFQVLSSDISYIRTTEGFEYICQVKDVKSGIVLASNMSDRMTSGLVERVIQALDGWNVPAGCIFHSDRGSQYTSESVKRLLSRLGLRQSFSRVGKPGDNAWSESFFANMKKESVHWVHFETREQARQAMFAYINGFYNTRRVQKRLGYISPMEWLKNWYRGNGKLAA